MTGIDTVIYFASIIFQAAGLSSASAAILATAGIDVVNVVMTMVATWLLISEIFPLAIRACGMSAATIINWLANLVIALTLLDLVDLLSRPGVFFLYAALTVGAFVFAWTLVPETRGLSLGAVAALWRRRAEGDAPGHPDKPVAVRPTWAAPISVAHHRAPVGYCIVAMSPSGSGRLLEQAE